MSIIAITNPGVVRGDSYFMVMTPAKQGNGILIAKIIAPFATEADATKAVELLNSRYPGTGSSIGLSQYIDDHDAEDLDRLYCQARGGLAEVLTDLTKGAAK
ncbi:hypothetical protein [Pseudomonas canadensis]|uniref:hypothetical protein n=1 Tax=Pseudomonas canadensis TaxID=915099 RepID=UPI00067F4B29|nr:hypothetical protein [Pseudomonas canadensis]